MQQSLKVSSHAPFAMYQMRHRGCHQALDLEINAKSTSHLSGVPSRKSYRSLKCSNQGRLQPQTSLMPNLPAGGDAALLVSTVCVHWAVLLFHPTIARSGSLGMICRALQGSACPGTLTGSIAASRQLSFDNWQHCVHVYAQL